jgi:hypothetical protein
MEQSSSWEACSYSVRKCSVLHKTRKFIAVFTRVSHWEQSSATWIQSTSSHPIYLRSVLISSNLASSLSSGFIPSDFPTEVCMHFSCLPCENKNFNNPTASHFTLSYMMALIYICLLAYLSIYPSIHPSIYPSICVSTVLCWTLAAFSVS